MDEPGLRLLIVDDEPNIRAGLARSLAGRDCEVATAADGEEALARFRERRPQLVVTDLKMPGAVSGLELIRRIKEERPETMVVVITAFGSIETAVEAMRLGAYDYLAKPIDPGRLRLLVRNAAELHLLLEENRTLRERLADAGEVPEMIGRSAAMRDLFAQIQQVADTDVTVLIQGESGSGKELVARALHRLGGRRDGPFVAVNIGALPESLAESELFGYEKGAFTGAHRRKAGWFEMAHKGTLFLDEIGEMSPKTQVDLLRVLERGEVRRLGGEEPVRFDVRLIVATHRPIEELVAEGKLREDVYYRLSVVPLRVPPLRERRDDIPLLVEHFLRLAQERHHRPQRQVAGAAMRALCDFPWPGNVRQLRNLVERLVVTGSGPVIHLEDLPGEVLQVPRREAETLEAAVREAERAAILAALDRCNQHRERTARLLGISVRNLHYKMNRYGLQ